MIADPLIATGTIAAKQTSAIGPLAEGVVEQIFVRVGDRVKKGQPLFQTRKSDYLRKVKELEAGLKVGDAELVKAQRDVRRATELVNRGLLATSQKEDAETAYNVAEARLQQAKTSLATAQQALQDTTVRSPFDGAISARYVDEGVYMSNRFSGMGNSAVVQVLECEIAAAILVAPEVELSRLRLGLSGLLYVLGHADPIQSKILILNDLVDPVARTVDFRMAFLNPDCQVKAGQFVRAEVNVDPRQVIVLPRSALRGVEGAYYVYVVEDSTASKFSIQVRDLDATRVEVLSNIELSQSVIVSPQGSVRDGTKVEIIQP